MIADDVWAKLLWSGLNLAEKDLPIGNRYPIELVRAVALTWLFTGLRSNEIVRLRMECVRWQDQSQQIERHGEAVHADAGYFARNLRTIEVLIDREAIASGAAAAGTPWQFYDLGHGLCTYNFFEQCPHRMACARCDFYLPNRSTRAQLLEAKDNLQRMLVAIPLTEEERAAVEDGQAAVERLLERLADVPTPSGPTPRALSLARSIPLKLAMPTRPTDP